MIDRSVEVHYVSIETDYEIGDEIVGVFDNLEHATTDKFTDKVEVWDMSLRIGTHKKSLTGLWTYTPD